MNYRLSVDSKFILIICYTPVEVEGEVKLMKRSTTVGACQISQNGAQRKLLAEFNRNESEGSTSPER